MGIDNMIKTVRLRIPEDTGVGAVTLYPNPPLSKKSHENRQKWIFNRVNRR